MVTTAPGDGFPPDSTLWHPHPLARQQVVLLIWPQGQYVTSLLLCSPVRSFDFQHPLWDVTAGTFHHIGNAENHESATYVTRLRHKRMKSWRSGAGAQPAPYVTKNRRGARGASHWKRGIWSKQMVDTWPRIGSYQAITTYAAGEWIIDRVYSHCSARLDRCTVEITNIKDSYV